MFLHTKPLNQWAVQALEEEMLCWAYPEPYGISKKPSHKIVAGWIPQYADSETETSQCSWDVSLGKEAGLGRDGSWTVIKASADSMGLSETGPSHLGCHIPMSTGCPGKDTWPRERRRPSSRGTLAARGKVPQSFLGRAHPGPPDFFSCF